MKLDLSAAMARAAEQVRLRDLMGATRSIQEALSGRPAGEAPPAQAPTRSSPAARRRPLIDPEAETVEPLDARDAPGASAPPRQATAPRSARLRRPLGAMLDLLKEGKGALGMQAPALRRAPPVEVPHGASFEARSFACEAGARDYKLYRPASAAEGLRGLVVMLHGCQQNPDDFAAGTAMNAIAERERLLVAYPGQTGSHNAMACWNWFAPSDQRRDAGEPAIIAGIVHALRSEFDLPAGRTMVAGLSAGGAMAAILGATYPDLFDAVGIHSGLPYRSANDVASAFAAMRGDRGLGAPPGAPGPRTIVFHGEADHTVHPVNAERIREAAGPGEIRRDAGRAPGGRAFRRETLLDPQGAPRLELWLVEGAGHAWSGGDAAGSYTDPAGPDASAEMIRFLFERP